jgi:Xaa-Pro dipeptidase
MTGIGGSTAAIELANLQRWPAPAPPIKREEHLCRVERAQRLMLESGADALLVGAGASLRYFTGVAWGATERLVAALIPKSGGPIMVCPAFEYDSLRKPWRSIPRCLFPCSTASEARRRRARWSRAHRSSMAVE